MKKKKNDGFTLVELGVAMVITSIIVIVVGTVVVTANRFFMDGSSQLQLQRDHALIIELLSNEIRSGSSDSSFIYEDSSRVATGPTVQSGSCLKVGYPSGEEQVFFQGGEDFVLITPSGTKIRLVTGIVDSLRFYYDNVSDSTRYINFNLFVNNGNLNLSSKNTVFFRN